MTADVRDGVFGNAYRGRNVLVTGHTGFKGSWLCEWLLSLGARVTGYALEPDTTPALFSQLRLDRRVQHVVADIRSVSDVRRVIVDTEPDFVFHLAAQPLVRRSYKDPVSTWETNVLGTVHVLDALRRLDKPCAAVMVTTDKCYENREWLYAYREIDPLGGHDPYSASKAAAELVVASWRNSFVSPGHPVRVASARAGNVIGGGDWAEDRIVPDAIRALMRGAPIIVRSPTATRPWQHVLEPLSGYLALAAAMATRREDRQLDSAFNIGPDDAANRTVRSLVEAVLRHWPGSWTSEAAPDAPHEAGLLHLDSRKIQRVLGWAPAWDFAEAVRRTVTWYRDANASTGHDLAERTRQDIQAYVASAAKGAVPWAIAGGRLMGGAGHD